MDLALLAETLTIILSPAAPYLATIGEKALEEAGKKLGAGTVEKASELWDRLRPAVDAEPAAAEAVADLAEDPEDEDLQAVLRVRLRKMLQKDAALASDLAALVERLGIGGGDRIEVHGERAIGKIGEVGTLVQGDYVMRSGPAPAAGVAPESDPERRRHAYLAWVMESAGYLRLGGVDPALPGREADTRLRLGAVYTALGTRTPRRPESPFEAGDGPGAAEDEPGSPLRERDAGTLSAVEQLDRHPRLALLGDAGSGKSTFLAYVALCLAGEALGRAEANLELLTAPPPKDDGSDSEERQPWSAGRLLPVRVVLRDFAARGLDEEASRATAQDLWSFLAAHLEEQALGAFVPQLERELREKGGLVLLDGLDEVPEAARRRHLICGAVASFAESFPRCRVVVTSRPYAYEKQDFRLAGFAEARLEPFGAGQIRRFVERWYAQVASFVELRPEQAARRAAALQRAIFSSRHLRELAGRPLLLTLMASLHSWRGGSLPEERARLYEETVQLLLDVWERQREAVDAEGRTVIQPSLAEWLEADRRRVRQVLEALAYEVHGAQAEQAGTADIDEGELVKRLLRLRDESPERDPLKLVEYLSERAGLLEARGPGVYTFPHRTFQEYLAACHLTSGHFDEDAIARLGREDPGRFREVVLLAAAKMAGGSTSSLWNLVEALCEADEEEDAVGLARAWGVRLAGQAVVEAGATEREGLSPRHRRRLGALSTLLTRVSTGGVTEVSTPMSLPAAERAAAGSDLGRLGDPRFDPAAYFLPAEPSLGFVEVPGGTFPLGEGSGNAPRRSVELATFYIARYPVTVAQYRAFLEDTDQEVDPEALDRPSNHPVVSVSWHDAVAYCRWLSTKLPEVGTQFASGELEVSLPTEAQWEAAARGVEGRIYPWGDEEATAEHANFAGTIGGTSPVGIYPLGEGPYGARDQAGTVWEWCLNAMEGDALRVLRGGSWAYPSGSLRASIRNGNRARNRLRHVGFRVCCRFRPEP